MSQSGEQILFEEIQKGNERAFNRAFDLYYSRLCFYADKILHDFDTSRSVVQQVFVDLWIKRENLAITSIQSYLYRAVHNSALDILKHKKIEYRYLSSLESSEPESMTDLIEEAELADRINRTIQKLPERCREIFMLCRFEEMKYAEIAVQLGISVKTVEMQISIALRRLRKELSDYQMVHLLALISSKKFQNFYRV